MIDRANAFRQHFDLDQERKYKELNLYVLCTPITFFPAQSWGMLPNEDQIYWSSAFMFYDTPKHLPPTTQDPNKQKGIHIY